METETIRERLQEYIRFADDKKVAAIYTMVESEIVEELNLWEDKDFLNEMKNRVDDYESGKATTLSLDEFKEKIRNR
jgi:putative addiction module component (TIGR02574 family)